MGIKGLYSCLKPYSHRVDYTNVTPSKIGLDAYPFLYKYKNDFDSCIALFRKLNEAGHRCTLYVDGIPPKEKMEELAQRRLQREQAYKQAEALKAFLNDAESSSLDTYAVDILKKKIAILEVESYSIKKEIRDVFLKKIQEETDIPIILCEGESDNALIQASKKGEIDIVIANDMDLFVGGVERLWVLGKTNSDPLFVEFQREEITRLHGLHSKSWSDIAILAGYEKTPQLKRYSVQQAINLLRQYGTFEHLFARRMDLLQGSSLEDFIEARKFFL